MTDPTLIGVRAAARLLDVHENTIRNMIRDGRLKDVRLPGLRHARLDLAQVEALAEARPKFDSELLRAASEIAKETGAITTWELMQMKEAIASRKLDEGDGETHTVE